MKIGKLFLIIAIAATWAAPILAQTPPSNIKVKVYFHDDKLDPESLDCNKTAPVTRTIPKTASVATAARQL